MGLLFWDKTEPNATLLVVITLVNMNGLMKSNYVNIRALN